MLFLTSSYSGMWMPFTKWYLAEIWLNDQVIFWQDKPNVHTVLWKGFVHRICILYFVIGTKLSKQKNNFVLKAVEKANLPINQTVKYHKKNTINQAVFKMSHHERGKTGQRYLRRVSFGRPVSFDFFSIFSDRCLLHSKLSALFHGWQLLSSALTILLKQSPRDNIPGGSAWSAWKGCHFVHTL